jgi:hypothetical protein
MAMLFLSIFYLFVSTPFVANVIVRDDDTASADRAVDEGHQVRLSVRPLLGAFAVAALGFLAIPLGIWLGSLMPWVDRRRSGPTGCPIMSGPICCWRCPTSCHLGDLLRAGDGDRSMMATYVGVVAFLISGC